MKQQEKETKEKAHTEQDKASLQEIQAKILSSFPSNEAEDSTSKPSFASTEDSVSAEKDESSLGAAELHLSTKAKAGIHRSDSLDRRLNEAAQFFQAVGEKPPTSRNELQRIIEDDDDSFSLDEENRTTEIRLNEYNSDPGLPLISDRRPALAKTGSRSHWPFERTKARPIAFFESLPASVRLEEFRYQGICSNPPEVTKRGISRGNYAQIHRKAWLEVSDKQHRYGKNLRLYYRHWESLGFPTNKFFDWLDSKGEAAGQSLPELEECPRSDLDADTVLYITDSAETMGYALWIKCDEKGRALVLDMDGERVLTGPDGWIFVLRDHVLYGARKITCVSGDTKKRFHHSSFFGGKAVSCAGILVTDDDGILTQVLPHSGHYRPCEADLQRMLFFLCNNGVNFYSFQVDIQQLQHINRKDAIAVKRRKMESLCLSLAINVAHYLSHKARLIDQGVFEHIHSRRTLSAASLRHT